MEDLMLLASPIYREGSDIWLAKVSLHCFEIVKMHCSDQVMQYCRLSQHIPGYIDTGNKLHNIIH